MSHVTGSGFMFDAIYVLASGSAVYDPKYAPFWTLGIVVGLALILHFFAWPKILKVLDEREARIRESLEMADKARAESQRIFDEHKKLVAEAQAESQRIVEAGKAAAEKLKEKIAADAKAESDAMLERAKREISLAEQKATAEIRAAAVNLTLAAAGKVLGKVLTTDEHRRLAEESLREVDRFGKN